MHFLQKRKKLIWIPVLLLFLSAIFGFDASASEDPAAARDYLMSVGFPADLVSEFADPLVLELYEDYRDSSVRYVYTEVRRQTEQNEILSLWEEGDLILKTTCVERIEECDPSLGEYQVVGVDLIVTWKWADGLPASRSEDKLTAAWDGALLGSDSFAARTYYQSKTNEKVTYETWESASFRSMDSVTWYNGLSRKLFTDVSGDARIELGTTKPIYGSERIFQNYQLSVSYEHIYEENNPTGWMIFWYIVAALQLAFALYYFRREIFMKRKTTDSEQ